MPKYMFRTSLAPEGAAGLLAEGGTARRTVVQNAIETLGGTLEAFYFAFGDDDVVGIIELPDNETAAAFALETSSSGRLSVSTTVLITPEELDRAREKRERLATSWGLTVSASRPDRSRDRHSAPSGRTREGAAAPSAAQARRRERPAGRRTVEILEDEGRKRLALHCDGQTGADLQRVGQDVMARCDILLGTRAPIRWDQAHRALPGRHGPRPRCLPRPTAWMGGSMSHEAHLALLDRHLEAENEHDKGRALATLTADCELAARAVAETTWSGTHVGEFLGIAPTGRPVELAVAVVVEFRDGLMAAERFYWDRAGLLEQLDTSEPPRPH